MASNNKRKTTMAKLQRERGLVEKRMAKQARKAARKAAAAEDAQPPAEEFGDEGFDDEPAGDEPDQNSAA